MPNDMAYPGCPGPRETALDALEAATRWLVTAPVGSAPGRVEACTVSELSDRQKLFAAEYPKDLNATQAALRAGYSKQGAARRGVESFRKNNPLSAI